MLVARVMKAVIRFYMYLSKTAIRTRRRQHLQESMHTGNVLPLADGAKNYTHGKTGALSDAGKTRCR